MLRPMFLPAPMMKAIGLVMVETRGVCSRMVRLLKRVLSVVSMC